MNTASASELPLCEMIPGNRKVPMTPGSGQNCSGAGRIPGGKYRTRRWWPRWRPLSNRSGNAA